MILRLVVGPPANRRRSRCPSALNQQQPLPVLQLRAAGFGLSARRVHMDTTTFAGTGEYAADLGAHTLAVTYRLLTRPPKSWR